MNYLKLLENSYEMEKRSSDCPPETRLAFLSEHVFNITTYDGKMDDFFGRKAVEVCAAITNEATFAFIKDPDNYQWFLIICNMPFFCTRLGWGTSIRGAWWDIGYDDGKREASYEINSCGIWDGDEQLTELQFSQEEWVAFMRAIVEFSQIKMTTNTRWTGKSDMQACDFPNGMTVTELKEMVRDWPETDEFGEPCEVWLCDRQGLSNQAIMATPLNMRQSGDKTKVWADFMLRHK